MKAGYYYAIAALAILCGCAKSTNEIPAQYVSPLQYSGYNCKQLELEMRSLASRISEMGGQVDKTASNDSAQAAVGIILFWPALFFLDGNTPQAAEYGRLKGEFEALEKASIQKECGFKIERPKAPIQAKPVEDKSAFGSPRQSSTQETPGGQ